MRLVKYYDEWKFIYPQEMDDVFDEYWNAVEFLGNDEKECQKRLKKIIRLFPEDHLDAYNHLSIISRNQNKAGESLHFALTSYLLGKNVFPKEFNSNVMKISWMDMNNRPFLRACQILGSEFQQRNQTNRAIELFEENLKYNPNDNQGIRYQLLECYLQQKGFDKFKELLDRYDEDYSVDFLYGKLIYAIFQNEGKLTDKLIIDAKKCNRYVITELGKDEHIKPEQKVLHWGAISEGIGVDPIQEAYEYWWRNKKVLNLKKVKGFFKFAQENYC
jgi:tetratricopeptide (TPR) repeat protein